MTHAGLVTIHVLEGSYQHVEGSRADGLCVLNGPLPLCAGWDLHVWAGSFGFNSKLTV